MTTQHVTSGFHEKGTKQAVTQAFVALVLDRDLRTVSLNACCGPALLRLPGRLLKYRPVGVETSGPCCHDDV